MLLAWGMLWWDARLSCSIIHYLRLWTRKKTTSNPHSHRNSLTDTVNTSHRDEFVMNQTMCFSANRCQWWKHIFTTTLICFQQFSVPYLFNRPHIQWKHFRLILGSSTSNNLHSIYETTQSSAVSAIFNIIIHSVFKFLEWEEYNW